MKLTAESQGIQEVQKLNEMKRSSGSLKGYEFLNPPKDLWKPMKSVWNRDKNCVTFMKLIQPKKVAAAKKDMKKSNPNMKLKKLLDDLK